MEYDWARDKKKSGEKKIPFIRGKLIYWKIKKII